MRLRNAHCAEQQRLLSVGVVQRCARTLVLHPEQRGNIMSQAEAETTTALVTRVRAYIADDHDPASRRELEQLLAQNDLPRCANALPASSSSAPRDCVARSVPGRCG